MTNVGEIRKLFKSGRVLTTQGILQHLNTDENGKYIFRCSCAYSIIKTISDENINRLKRWKCKPLKGKPYNIYWLEDE